jgi:magnesium transporter
MNDQLINHKNLNWIDLVDPQKIDFDAVAKDNNVHPEAIIDVLDPEHLPKFEIINDFSFLILRAYDPESSQKSDSVRGLTRKLAVFFKEGTVITIHRKPHSYVKDVYSKYLAQKDLAPDCHLKVLYDLVTGVVKSYESGVKLAYEQFDAFEQQVFNQDQKPIRLKNSYVLKRHVSIMKRVLRMNQDAIEEALAPLNIDHEILLQNIKEQISKYIFQLDEIRDGLTALLNLQVSLVSQKTNEASRKTNEVVRVLTIFSMFVMPLNFIASLYGMNFKFMPELEWEYGYFAVLAAMLAVELLVYSWFRSKGWLSGI